MKISGKSILIVDDDSSLRMVLRKILETAGCTVTEASGVRDAILQIQENIPDLTILDLNMPEHSGFTFLLARSKNERMAKSPVLVLSGVTNETVIEKALALGAVQFVQKPLKANTVLQKVKYIFYSQENSSFQFPDDAMPTVLAEVNGLVTGHSETQLKVSSVVKFERGRPLQVKADDYLKSGGSLLVARVDNRRVEVGDGLYSQAVTLVGLSKEEKEKYQEWERKL